MLAWMNAEGLARDDRNAVVATYWSRSRQELWIKGETSGHVQEVVEVMIDCDQDAVLLESAPDRRRLPYRAQGLFLSDDRAGDA